MECMNEWKKKSRERKTKLSSCQYSTNEWCGLQLPFLLQFWVKIMNCTANVTGHLSLVGSLQFFANWFACYTLDGLSHAKTWLIEHIVRLSGQCLLTKSVRRHSKHNSHASHSNESCYWFNSPVRLFVASPRMSRKVNKLRVKRLNRNERLHKNDGKKKKDWVAHTYTFLAARNTFNAKIEIILRTNEIKLIRNIIVAHIYTFSKYYLLKPANICPVNRTTFSTSKPFLFPMPNWEKVCIARRSFIKTKSIKLSITFFST